MPVSPPPTRRFLLTLILTSTLLATLFVTTFRAQPLGTRHPHNALPLTTPTTPIMPPLNDTLRADLGRASWKLLHTIAARFPTHPTPDERAALQTWIHLFVRLYPCGECARHFAEVVARFPPQVSGRNAAAGWACHVHNVVNARLGKAEFDCARIGEFYDCGCGEEGETTAEGEGEGETAGVEGAGDVLGGS